MEVLFFWIAFSLAIAILANRYRRSAIGWFVVAAVFSPFLALIFLLALGAIADPDLQMARPRSTL